LNYRGLTLSQAFFNFNYIFLAICTIKQAKVHFITPNNQK